MLLRAAEEYNIDLTKSFMIGDSENDALCGKNVGCKGVQIGENMEFVTLLDLVDTILEGEPKQ